MISVVSVYNDERMLAEYLMKSLECQTSLYEPILIDNRKMRFKSVAEALNYGGKLAKGKYIMFMHQDIDLVSTKWIEDVEKILNSIQNLGIAGVAGMSEEGRTNKERGRNVIKSVDSLWEWGNPIQKPEPVQTLDECLAIIPKAIFDHFKFDEEACDGWHLYVVDYCLSMKEKGLGVYAIPMYIYHISYSWSSLTYSQSLFGCGPILKGYFGTLGKVCRKHRSKFTKIYTTCGTWDTSTPLILQRMGGVALQGLYALGVILGLRFLWRRLKAILKGIS